MDTSLQNQFIIRRVFLLAVFWLCACFPMMAWSEAAEQEGQTTIDLEDGTVIELTETAVIRKESEPASESDAVQWSISAQKPQLPLLFENREGVQLLLYFNQIREHYGEFHAVHLENGQKQWAHPLWIRSEQDMPVGPVFIKPWIYLGRGMWLEKMDPDDGRIVKHYPARVAIRSLEALPDGTITVHAESSGYTDKIDVSLRFQDGQFSPHIVAPGDFFGSLELSKRAEYVVEDFVGTLSSDYTGYLDLHRIKKEPLPSEFAAKWEDFNLQSTEKTYQQAYQADLTNPYFALYLALSIYYQDRQTEAEPYFEEAFTRSADFWEESLRLGGICESLGFTEWADAFYEQGAARYFQEVPAPPHDVWLMEVLIHFFGQSQSAELYANGQIDRALHVLEVRRQIFPYTGGDTLFSLQYARWLDRMGREDQAILEEQRLEHRMFWDGFEPLSPSSFLGFLIIGLLLLGVIILRNEIHHPYELPVALVTMVVIGRTMSAAGVKTGWGTVILLVVLVFVYSGVMAFFRKRRISPPSSLWRTMLQIMASSYIVILTGIFVAYALGYQLSGSPLVGKVVEILYILVFIGFRYWVRRGPESIPSFRNPKLFAVVCLVLWAHLAWFHYFISFIGIEAGLPIPLVDRGHPNWIAYVDQNVKEARFQNRGLLLIQALVHQLGGDKEFARKAYEQIPDDARAMNNLGVMVWDKEPDDARVYFERALKIDPDCAPAIYNMGVLSDDRGQIDRARAADPWRVDVYQKYAPDKPWIATPKIREWDKARYWSQGGLLVGGFIEVLFQILSLFSTVSVLS